MKRKILGLLIIYIMQSFFITIADYDGYTSNVYAKRKAKKSKRKSKNITQKHTKKKLTDDKELKAKIDKMKKNKNSKKDGESPLLFKRSNRVDFDERIIKGQTAQSGAVYLFQRKDTQLKSLIKTKKSYQKEIVEEIFSK